MQNLLSKGRLSSFLVPSFYRFSSSGSTATTTSSTSPQFEKNQKRNELIFYLNKKRISLPSGSFSTTTSLLDFVRESGLTGAKPGCLEGGCGACTLQVSSVRFILFSHPFFKFLMIIYFYLCFVLFWFSENFCFFFEQRRGKFY